MAVSFQQDNRTKKKRNDRLIGEKKKNTCNNDNSNNSNFSIIFCKNMNKFACSLFDYF